MFGLVTVDIYKVFGDSRPVLNHETYLTEVSSISCLFNSFRGIWSALLDHYSFKKVYGVLLVLQISLAFTYKWSSETKTTYALWVWLSVWCEGGHFTLFPNILKIIYGKHATRMYGVLYSYCAVTSLLMIYLLQTDLGQAYIWFWVLGGCLSIISLVELNLFFNQEKFVAVKAP